MEMRTAPRSGVLLVLLASAVFARPSPAEAKGKLETINGCVVLHVEGSPEQMGEQHGRLLKDKVRRVVATIMENAAFDREKLLAGAAEMERYIPDDYRRELHALAKAAGVDYRQLVTAQLFGDVLRAQLCTVYAVFGRATQTGECIVGRNMDYFDYGIGEFGCVLIHFTPEDGLPFVTVSWAGVINGWTAMNRRGIVVANNTAYGPVVNSLKGMSTCFVVRRVAQFAKTVSEGVDIVKIAPRSCGTSLLIAGGEPPSAVVVEYDHESLAVRNARRGVVMADNDLCSLHRDKPYEARPDGTRRYDKLAELIRRNYGRINRSMNFLKAEGVALRSINLHSALLFPRDLSFRVSMGKVPACDYPYRAFRMTDTGLVSAEK